MSIAKRESRRFREVGRFEIQYERKLMAFGDHCRWETEGGGESEISNGLQLHDFQKCGNLERKRGGNVIPGRNSQGGVKNMRGKG